MCYQRLLQSPRPAQVWLCPEAGALRGGLQVRGRLLVFAVPLHASACLLQQWWGPAAGGAGGAVTALSLQMFFRLNCPGNSSPLETLRELRGDPGVAAGCAPANHTSHTSTHPGSCLRRSTAARRSWGGSATSRATCSQRQTCACTCEPCITVFCFCSAVPQCFPAVLLLAPCCLLPQQKLPNHKEPSSPLPLILVASAPQDAHPL